MNKVGWDIKNIILIYFNRIILLKLVTIINFCLFNLKKYINCKTIFDTI